MPHGIARAGKAAFALLVAAGLTLGARSAVASPGTASTCPYNPSIGYIGASCTTHAYCTQVCTDFYQEYSPSRCDGGCCTCAY